MMEKISLKLVYYLPKELDPGFLYVSKEFGIAGHMCPCGCGNKVITPIGPTDWSLTIKGDRPTLSPSIGNWQIPCRSHYWIKDGLIKWSYPWTEEEVLVGRQEEQKRRKAYYDELEHKKAKRSKFKRFLFWLLGRDKN